jgi:hypothetical protein
VHPPRGSVALRVNVPPMAAKKLEKYLLLIPIHPVWYRKTINLVGVKYMKRYTLRRLIHDAKVFYQLRTEYRRTKKERRKDSNSGSMFGYVAGTKRRAVA